MKKKKILIIDDDAEFCQEMGEILRSKGYSITSTSDPVEGAGLIHKKSYDICLFDYKMPVFSGVDLLKRAKKKNPESAVFIISGRPFIEKILKEENAFNAVTGIIKKPFSAELLLQKIRAIS